MLQLKDYQRLCLDELRSYFALVGKHGAKAAFVLKTERPYREVPHLPGLPYVCLRVPTGGGKTLMACHALSVAAKEYLQQERAVCLWLVPTKQIAQQTLKALQDRSHPYRQVLDEAFAGNVSVMSLGDALYVQRDTLEGDATVIVSTLAALRVEDTEGRKIYESAGELMHHFSKLTPAIEAKMERDTDGVIARSLANVLRMWEPVVIMDEAHNARTKLSFETLERFSPSAIIEFTATPQREHDPERGRYASNVLAHVSAAQLKIENMIKLPIKLHTRSNWKEVLTDTVQAQRDLEKVAQQEQADTGEYIRPIVLLQSQPKRDGQETITAEAVKQALLADCKVPEEQIAIATGDTREIAGVDLFKPDCEIRFIITQQALKEGWDCSFAYIFCSVADIGSAKDVEQLLGRVLRLPQARSKKRAELNRAYAMISSQRFVDTLGLLAEALIENGFERIEAEQFLMQVQPKLPGFGPLFDNAVVSEKVSEPPDLTRLDEGMRQRVIFDVEASTLTVAGIMTATERTALEKCFKGEEARRAVQRLYDASRGRGASPGTATEPMHIPALCIKVDGQWQLFEDSHFLDAGWDLSKCCPTLTETEFPSEVLAGADGEVDVSDTGRVEARFVQQVRQQLALLRAEGGWTLAGLVNWIDKQVYHPDVTRTQSTLFIYRAIENLMQTRGVTVDQLATEKFRLASAVAAVIEKHRQAMRRDGYQKTLFGPQAAELETSPAIPLVVGGEQYAPKWYYEGTFQFPKHALPMVGELKSDGEEFECAQYIESLPQVRRWIRNIDRGGDCSFWLQTSTDRFYPDFVAELTDGRWLVVEYKGEHLWSNDDSKEKRAVGNLWADRSDGRCLFAMPKGADFRSMILGF